MGCRAGTATVAAMAVLALPSVAQAERPGADPVVDWNALTLQTTAAGAFNPPLESRNVAIVQAAVFDAVDAIRPRYRPYAVRIQAPRDASITAAVAAAAHTTLVALYPEQQLTLDSTYASYVDAIPDGPAKRNGIALGAATASAELALRSGDHASDVESFTPGSGPGAWIPTAPLFRPALDPGWGKVTPFFLRAGSQFRPAPPPTVTSRAYTRDYRETVELGSALSTTRTEVQTSLARLWVTTAPQVWNEAVQQLATAHHLSAVSTARAFALLNMAGADAFIAAWDGKFAYAQWRPVTAIQNGDGDGNPATAGDPAWLPMLTTPPFPDYPAGHTTYAGAAEAVLTGLFSPTTQPFTLTSATAPGFSLTYRSFAAVAADVVEARVLGGIHWRTSSTVGRSLGQQVGRYAVAHGLGLTA
jgi:hypothetical protein